ncbi:MAG: serine/threonine-protein kinase [Myxococcota bacterium]|nr:serine/threonine-protein kinase [Myxococcota bacterium]
MVAGARLPKSVGPYRIKEAIGLGGMGIVVSAHHEILGRQVAIKFRFHDDRPDNERLHERFRHGAALQSELNHPHVAQVFDFIETDGYQAIVMEYLAGGSVESYLKRQGGQLDVGDVLRVGIRVANALAYSHGEGIIHRDIKPANLMMARPDRLNTIRLTDYGVAKAPDRSPDITVVGANVGTLWYMSPEQLSHETVLPASDVYSFGATLYELLTGQIPFARAETSEVFRRFLDGAPVPPIQGRNPNVPDQLAHVIEQTLRLDVETRLGDAAVLSLLLRAVAHLEGYPSIARLEEEDFPPVDESIIQAAMNGLPEEVRLPLYDTGMMLAQRPTGLTQSLLSTAGPSPFDTSVDQMPVARPLINEENFTQLDDEWIRQTDEEVEVVEFSGNDDDHDDDDDDDADRTIVTSQEDLNMNDGD